MTRRAGYSLLEVLIAFAVMAMVISVLVPGQAQLLARAGTSAERLRALDYAASRLDALGLSEPLPVGIREAVYREWRIIERVDEEILSDLPVTVLRVSVEVVSIRSSIRLASVETLRSSP